MATSLQLPNPHVVGLLVQFWSWADAETETGHIDGMTVEELDKLVATPGFANALASVGWLSADDAGLVIPNFERHMGKSSKRRALDVRRKESNVRRRN